jgi:hypothetical protein
MPYVLLRMATELGPAVTLFAIFFAAVITVFVVYVGIALRAVLRATDQEQRQVLYEVFRDLLDLFRPKRRQ